MRTIGKIASEVLVGAKKFSILEGVQLLIILAFTSTLTLGTRTNSFLLICTVVSLLFSFRISNLQKLKTPLILFISGFLLSLLAILWSADLNEGGKVIERQLALVMLPVFFFAAFKYDSLKFRMILVVFYLSIVAVCLYLLNCSALNFFNHDVTLKEFTVKENLYHAFARPIGMHATYLSLFVGLAVFIGFHWLLSPTKLVGKFVIFISILILVITLALLSSRVVIVSLIAILFLIYPFFIGMLRNRLLLLIGVMGILMTFFFIFRESSFISSRFLDKMDDEVKMTSFLKPDSTYNPIYGGETRADRWYCAAELIKERPWFGYGTGSEKVVLMKKYEKYNLQNAIINGYDAHNQYMAYAIKGGIFALVAFVLSLLYGIYVSIKEKNFLYLAFMLLFSVACITENVLESNKGIFFYAFFNTLLCYKCLAEKKSSEK